MKKFILLKIICAFIILIVSPSFARIMDQGVGSQVKIIPFYKNTDSTLIEGYVEYLEVPGISATFVDVRAGTFRMGSSLNEIGRQENETQHLVTLTQDFQIQTTEVTQLQYFLFTGDNPSYFREEDHCKEDYKVIRGVSLCPNYPVEQVSWMEAQEFIYRLNQRSHKYTHRLPTEAEWEYVARGCQNFGGLPTDLARCATRAFNLGNNISTDQVNYNGTLPYNNGPQGVYRDQTVRVGSLPNANNLGVYDTHGNVWEWVQDSYGEYPHSYTIDPQGPLPPSLEKGEEDLYRVLRGGSWYNRSQDARLAFRAYLTLNETISFLGFRLVRTPK